MRMDIKFSTPLYHGVKDLYLVDIDATHEEWSEMDFYEASLDVLDYVMARDREVRLTYDRFGHPNHVVVEWHNSDGNEVQISVDRAEIKKRHPEWTGKTWQVWTGVMTKEG